jgi:hypothetical protein
VNLKFAAIAGAGVDVSNAQGATEHRTEAIL